MVDWVSNLLHLSFQKGRKSISLCDSLSCFPKFIWSLSLSLSLSLQVLLNLLYFYGMCGVLKECLLQRYFSKVLHTTLALIFFSDFGKNYILNLLLQELRCGLHGAESDIIQSCRRVRILMHNRDMPVYLSCLGKIELV